SLTTAPHPTALLPYDIIPVENLRESLLGLGALVADQGIGGDGSYAAARELLLRRVPRLENCTLADFQKLSSLEAAKKISLLLDRTVLPIQGPPGSGKTFTGALMILELIRNGKRVGITAVSHKVISNLLKTVCNAATAKGLNLKVVQRCTDSED